MKNFRKTVNRVGLGSALLLAAGAASAEVAATPLPAEVQASIDSATSLITGIGGAMLVLAALAMSFKWAKASFF